MKIHFSLILILFCVSAGIGQQYSYGKLRDLKGTHIFYIDTSLMRNYDLILSEIKKSNLHGLRFTGARLQSEIILKYSQNQEDAIKGQILVDKDGSIRIIKSFSSDQFKNQQSFSPEFFVKEFIKIYKKANNLK